MLCFLQAQPHPLCLSECYNTIMFYEVMPTEVYRADGGALTYSYDPKSQNGQKLLPGHIVLIPVGRRQIPGIVMKRVPSVNFPTKPISRLIHPTPIPQHLLRSITWLSKYYLAPAPTVANLLLPAGLISKKLLKQTIPDGELPLNNNVTSGISATTPSQDHLQSKNLRANSENEAYCSFSGISSDNGSWTKRRLAYNDRPSQACPETNNSLISLNSAQKHALRALQEAPGTTRLLRGVTGSGKTNIYLKMASGALLEQKSTILLVPEIALTSQIVKIFTQTFGNRVVLIHSNQTLAERRKTWLRILEASEPLIIIGPRSALLSPVHNLGLIIIDEAHEGAYYQENTPRYSALRLASFMASSLKIPCIQGTATPNIVDFHLSKAHNSLIELTEKAKSTAITPQSTIVDLKDRANFLKNRYFSNQLLTSIENNIQAGHQTLIFHNRRGSSPLTICEECGWQALCPTCYLPMTLHTDGFLLACHICGHEEKVPTSCPSCGHPGIIHKGFGTKLLESELTRLFPKAKIARFDGDNNKKSSLAELYNDVKTGKIDILIGTQTLARGLDLPLLATVGVVQADAGLSLPDFAAEERTFELLTQVIGRVGRGHLDRAEVVIQTYQPDHPVIQTAIQADFSNFAKYLLEKRRTGKLPPYTYLARLSITYKTEKTTLKYINQAFQTLSQNPKLAISPPTPAFHERTASGFTWQLIIKSTSRETLRQALTPFSKYRIELDPPSLL